MRALLVRDTGNTGDNPAAMHCNDLVKCVPPCVCSTCESKHSLLNCPKLHLHIWEWGTLMRGVWESAHLFVDDVTRLNRTFCTLQLWPSRPHERPR
eukprot:3184415-Amphidinium_carterae.1